MIKIIAVVIVTLILISGGVFIFTNIDAEITTQDSAVQSSETVNTEEQVESNTPETQASAGQYIGYDEYLANKDSFSDKQVVLFFNAKWCPTCQALNKDINANLASIPEDVVIVSVDYDSNIDLRRQYGVTVQHTLVIVDSEGNQIKKWTGGNTLDSVVSQV